MDVSVSIVKSSTYVAHSFDVSGSTSATTYTTIQDTDMWHSLSTFQHAFRQSHVPIVDQVSDLLALLYTSSRGAEPCLENAASLMPDRLLRTVFQPTFIKSVTPVYLNAVLKLNYSVEHIVASFVSAPGRFVNSTL